MNDLELIARLLDGDSEVTQTVRGWMRAAYSPYRQRLAADLEDLEQEILLDLTLALRVGKFRHQSSLRTYVRTYVHHKCIDRTRSLGRRQWLDLEELELPSQKPSPFDQLSSSEATAVGLEVFQQMPESCRELWRMLEQGMRYREMSETLGIGEGALRARVARCRKGALQLRSRMLGEKNRKSS